MKTLVLAFLGIGLAGLAASQPTKSAFPPSGNFDLSHWALDLPVDSNGGTTGVMAIIAPARLAAGYASPWFYTAADGSMAFWCPVNGATSSGSSHPRTELREMLNPQSNSSNWWLESNAVLSATLLVAQVPASGQIIVGQVHGDATANYPVAMICFDYSRSTRLAEVSATFVKTPANNSFNKRVLASGIPVGAKFSYEIRVRRGTLSVGVNGNWYSEVLDPSWMSHQVYFKAGDYVIDSGSSATIGGLVRFYALTAVHPELLPLSPSGLRILSAR
jgi:hypothetical protein